MIRPQTYSCALRLAFVAFLALLSACKQGVDSAPAAASSSAASEVATDGAISPDLSNSRCQLLPPENIAEYKRAHDLFNSPPGLTPQFSKGQLFKGGDTVSFKATGMGTLGVDVVLLRDCSLTGLGGFFLSETAPGSGEISGMILTSAAGSSYESGTPGLLQVTSTTVDMETMKGTTKIVAEYTIRLQEPN
ncbi:MAG: hypothetical protein M3O62_10470 [Pseudomonadota bacterium]|nr:hypothetical protein [Pseudomonadota bacterium]